MDVDSPSFNIHAEENEDKDEQVTESVSTRHNHYWQKWHIS